MLDKPERKPFEVVAKIGNADGSDIWEETLPVSSLDTAEDEVKEIVKEFNATLRSHEKPRKFYELILKRDISALETKEDVLKEVYRFYRKVERESQNAYGYRWCQDNYNKVRSAYRLFVNKGGSFSRLRDLISRSPYSADFQHLVKVNLRKIRR